MEVPPTGLQGLVRPTAGSAVKAISPGNVTEPEGVVMLRSHACPGLSSTMMGR